MKVLNLYAGIGGNRKLWENVEVTAVENVPDIAAIYQDFFPNDTVVIADAHQYLLDHFHEFDFIWSSPPCPTHSKARYGLGFGSGKTAAIYPDMRLYQEILLLKHHFKGQWCVENVQAYYQPLIQPQTVGRHWYWANFYIPKITVCPAGITKTTKFRNGRNPSVSMKTVEEHYEHLGIDLSAYNTPRKRLLLRNAVEPEIGLHILSAVQGVRYHAKGIELVALDLELA